MPRTRTILGVQAPPARLTHSAVRLAALRLGGPLAALFLLLDLALRLLR